MSFTPKFWKPGKPSLSYKFTLYGVRVIVGAPRPSSSIELERVIQGNEGAGSCMTFNTHLHLSISQQRQRLPIFKVRRQLWTYIVLCMCVSTYFLIG